MKLTIVSLLFVASVCVAADDDSVWHTESVDDSGGNVVVLSQDSLTSVRGEAADNEVTPRLEFFCSPGDTMITARIDWQRFISSFSTEAGFKVDGGLFTWLKWKVDSSEKVTTSPSVADSQKLIDLLSNGSDLLVEISPYSQSAITAQFSLEGFVEALENLSNACR